VDQFDVDYLHLLLNTEINSIINAEIGIIREVHIISRDPKPKACLLILGEPSHTGVLRSDQRSESAGRRLHPFAIRLARCRQRACIVCSCSIHLLW